ncbi:unnamed protein product [Discosporangium mesarthrocarpum]
MANAIEHPPGGDTKKVRKRRKKLEGKAAAGSICTVQAMRECEEHGVHVRPLFTTHLERHGRKPSLSAKEVREFILHAVSGSLAPKFAEVRNRPSLKSVVVIALSGVGAAPRTPDGVIMDDSSGGRDGAAQPKRELESLDILDAFSQEFRDKFQLCARLRLGSVDGEKGLTPVKSLSEALLYSPLGEDAEACPDGPFGAKRRRKGEKKKRKGIECKRGRVDDLDEGKRGDSGRGDDDADRTDEEEDDDDCHALSEGGEAEDEVEKGKAKESQGWNGCDDTVEGGVESESKGKVGGSGDRSQGKEERENARGVEQFLLTTSQLKEYGFPLPSEPFAQELINPRDDSGSPAEGYDWNRGLPTMETALRLLSRLPEVPGLSGYVQTQSWGGRRRSSGGEGGAGGDGSRNGEIFGLDCEMCMTMEGLELTRVTIVNRRHEVVLDELVKPTKNITDYLTRWSGITAHMLEGVETSLCQVQAAVLGIVGSGDTLVGHSLENDLRALRVVHTRCLDTAVLFPHHKPGKRSSLRFLATMYLRRKIQGSGKGHDSREDAVAALDLAQLKMSKGPNFGMERCSRSVFETLGRKMVDCALVATQDVCRFHAAGAVSTLPTFSDDGVIQSTIKQIAGRVKGNQAGEGGQGAGKKEPFLLWAELEGPTAPTLQALGAAAAHPAKLKILDKLNTVGAAGVPGVGGHEGRVQRVLEGLPTGILVVVAAQGWVVLPRKLERQKRACQDSRCASTWTEAQQGLLEALQGRAREGCVLFAVT